LDDEIINLTTAKKIEKWMPDGRQNASKMAKYMKIRPKNRKNGLCEPENENFGPSMPIAW